MGSLVWRLWFWLAWVRFRLWLALVRRLVVVNSYLFPPIEFFLFIGISEEPLLSATVLSLIHSIF